MSYVDAFVAAVPTANEGAYLEHAAATGPLFKEYGALAVMELWGDDVPRGETTDLYRAVACNDDEGLVLSWVVWPDKATRDAGWAQLMQDPRMSHEAAPMPFDGSRLIHGGFRVLMAL